MPPLSPTVWSSFALGVASVACQGSWLCPIFCFQMGLSILNHSREEFEGVINRVDKVVAHAIGVGTLLDASSLLLARGGERRWVCLVGYGACMGYCFWVFHVLRHMPRVYNTVWHATMHVAAATGAVCLHMARL